MSTTTVKFQLRNDTATNWSKAGANPTLIVGEPGFESDTGKLKIGDGTKAWNSLPYLNTAGSTGPTGPTGTQGHTGPQGPTGTSSNGSPNTPLTVAVSGGTILKSTDSGLTWTAASGSVFNSTNSASSGGNGVAYGNGRWVAVGGGTTDDNTILTSTDGSTWTTVSGTTFKIQGNGVVYGNGRWVAVGSTSPTTESILTSTDGLTWTTVSGTKFDDVLSGGQGVAWNGTRFVAVGYGTNNILVSTDGVTWTASGISGQFSVGGKDVIWQKDKFIACGGAEVRTSPDGLTWTRRTATLPPTMQKLASNGTLAVLVGANTPGVGTGTAQYSSTDGITWTASSGSQLVNGTSVAWNGKRWVACGTGGTPYIVVSTDGLTWTTSGITGFDGTKSFSGMGTNNLWKSLPTTLGNAVDTLLEQVYLLKGTNTLI